MFAVRRPSTHRHRGGCSIACRSACGSVGSTYQYVDQSSAGRGVDCYQVPGMILRRYRTTAVVTAVVYCTSYMDEAFCERCLGLFVELLVLWSLRFVHLLHSYCCMMHAAARCRLVALWILCLDCSTTAAAARGHENFRKAMI